jgi:hypothetical protein
LQRAACSPPPKQEGELGGRCAAARAALLSLVRSAALTLGLPQLAAAAQLDDAAGGGGAPAAAAAVSGVGPGSGWGPEGEVQGGALPSPSSSEADEYATPSDGSASGSPISGVHGAVSSPRQEPCARRNAAAGVAAAAESRPGSARALPAAAADAAAALACGGDVAAPKASSARRLSGLALPHHASAGAAAGAAAAAVGGTARPEVAARLRSIQARLAAALADQAVQLSAA